MEHRIKTRLDILYDHIREYADICLAKLGEQNKLPLTHRRYQENIKGIHRILAAMQINGTIPNQYLIKYYQEKDAEKFAEHFLKLAGKNDESGRAVKRLAIGNNLSISCIMRYGIRGRTNPFAYCHIEFDPMQFKLTEEQLDFLAKEGWSFKPLVRDEFGTYPEKRVKAIKVANLMEDEVLTIPQFTVIDVVKEDFNYKATVTTNGTIPSNAVYVHDNAGSIIASVVKCDDNDCQVILTGNALVKPGRTFFLKEILNETVIPAKGV